MAGRRGVGLSRQGLWLDVEVVRTLLGDGPDALDRPLRAVEHYRDDFLAGFGLRDSGPFDDWQSFQAESLRAELAAALERLVREEVGAGSLQAAIGHARRWLALDPLHEPAHRELMRLYAAPARQAPSLRQYRECVRSSTASWGSPHWRTPRRCTAGPGAGHVRRRPGDFREAGDHARALYANAVAIGHYRAALALGGPAPTALYEAIGDVHTRTGAYADVRFAENGEGLSVQRPERGKARER